MTDTPKVIPIEITTPAVVVETPAEVTGPVVAPAAAPQPAVVKP
jgi:hypothetical protein